ncbi:MAG TPA: polysaccharide deacetylase family protein [Candidatus Sulfotelmatobacter sp.]|nr:polysaccharide deacetylase family protein [Candidatus Sulfotelmatobacter sp.]
MSDFALRALQTLGVFSLTRSLSAGLPRILMYHDFCGPEDADEDAINAEALRRQFSYLRRNFRVVSLSQLAEELSSGANPARHTVALTIDDGRRNCYEFLFPLIKEFELPATFFVVSSFISGEDWIWTDKVIWLSRQKNCPEALLPDSLPAVFGALNKMRPEARNGWIETTARSMSVSIPKTPPPRFAPCSWTELREMSDSGLMEIGSHTVTHPILSSITDEESWQEVTQSRSQIMQAIGRPVNCFCYPNGKGSDYRPSQVQQIAEAGYRCAVIAEFGMVQSRRDLFRLPRMGMTRKRTPAQIAKYLEGFAYYQHRVQARNSEA